MNTTTRTITGTFTVESITDSFMYVAHASMGEPARIERARDANVHYGSVVAGTLRQTKSAYGSWTYADNRWRFAKGGAHPLVRIEKYAEITPTGYRREGERFVCAATGQPVAMVTTASRGRLGHRRYWIRPIGAAYAKTSKSGRATLMQEIQMAAVVSRLVAWFSSCVPERVWTDSARKREAQERANRIASLHRRIESYESALAECRSELAALTSELNG